MNISPSTEPGYGKWSVRIAFLAICFSAISGPPNTVCATDPPVGYYDSATGAGQVLADQLHEIIDDHTVLNYNSARSNLQIVDADPNQAGHIILVYTNESLDLNPLAGNSIPGWDSGRSWNREHTWPQSRSVGSSGPDTSDLHQLRPSDPSINSSRGNRNFGGAFGLGSPGNIQDGNGTVWYPGDIDAGRIARQQFYLDVRYDGSDSSTEDLVLTTGNPAASTGQLGDLERLIEWHYAAPVDEYERNRNQIIDSQFQGNRNPFIDRPEFAWSVFKDQQNDSRIEVAGGTSDGQGGSTLDLSIARVIAGTDAPKTAQVTLSKSGLDGTYYSVTTTGPATSSIDGRFNAFQTNQTDTRELTVGLIGSTATPGVTTGTVSIDNLDITNNGGVGRGNNDGDDTINLSLTALAHAEPSFSSLFPLSSQTIDLGDFFLGSQFTPTTTIDIANRASVFGEALTARLDLDAILETDTQDQFSFEENLFSGLAAGENVSVDFVGLADQLGQFAASYEFQLSDEDIPGAEGSTLSLNLLFDVVAEVGDFTISGNIDDEDIDFYAGRLGTQITSESEFRELDLDDDGTITLADHNIHVTTLAETAIGKGALLGDINFDGLVDVLSDAASLLENLGTTTDVGYAKGDLNADGSVDVLGDASILIANLGLSSSAASAVTTNAVPEPSGIVVLWGVATLLACRRR